MILRAEAWEIRTIVKIEAAIPIKVLDDKDPTKKAGLTFGDSRTVAALLSAALFVLGCIIGQVELWTTK
jgi:hypothetical protein